MACSFTVAPATGRCCGSCTTPCILPKIAASSTEPDSRKSPTDKLNTSFRAKPPGRVLVITETSFDQSTRFTLQQHRLREHPWAPVGRLTIGLQVGNLPHMLTYPNLMKFGV